MLGVDRLDMVKGIPQKLLAYEKFLEVSWPPSWDAYHQQPLAS